MRIYVASPLGFSEAGRAFYAAQLLPLVRQAGHEVIDPWGLTAASAVEAVRAMAEGPARRAAWRELNRAMAAANTEAIESADALLAVLDGPDVDSGTAAEVGYAAALGKRLVGYRGDFRLSADNEGAAVNLQVEYFILRGGGIVTTLAELAGALAALRDE